jgi:protein-disulfide isomerase
MHTIKHFFTKVFHVIKNITLTTPVAIIIGACIISVGLVGYGYVTTSGGGSTATMFKGKPVDSADYVFGNKKSDVVVIEYSDPECPFCVQLSPTIKQIQSEYGDKIAFVYRHFPLTQIHSKAFDESRAISCAGVVGGDKGFYEYVDNFFGYKYSKQTNQLPPNGAFEIAKNVGLDNAKFTACMNSQATAQAVNDQQADGVKAGVQGTPSTFILLKKRGGYEVIAMIDGARQFQAFTAAIDEALNR